MVESDLAHTDALRSNLNELVALDILKTFLKTHYDLRYHTSLLVRATGTHIGELLGLGNVDYEVIVVNMFAHYLTAVNLFTRINEELPYTLPQLRNILETLCGKGNYSADVEEGTYQLLVKIGLAAKNNFNDVESLLNRVVPQNMVVTLLQLYNTHAELGRFTHAQLAAYTHNQLRNEVLKNGE